MASEKARELAAQIMAPVIRGMESPYRGKFPADGRASMEHGASLMVDAAVAPLVSVLEDAIDSLEYVQRNHPDISGSGVRHERIAAAQKALEGWKK